jgi:hypothetical protein
MNSAGYCNFSCPYHSPIKVDQTVTKPQNNSSVNITKHGARAKFWGYVE